MTVSRSLPSISGMLRLTHDTMFSRGKLHHVMCMVWCFITNQIPVWPSLHPYRDVTGFLSENLHYPVLIGPLLEFM